MVGIHQLVVFTFIALKLGFGSSSAFSQDVDPSVVPSAEVAEPQKNEEVKEEKVEDDGKAAETGKAPEATTSEEPKVAVDPAPVSDLPVVVSHSELQSSIYQGDKIQLTVNAQGQNLLYRWVRNYKTICTTSTCKIDTAAWGVGSQNITVVIYNNFGSQTISFTVRSMIRPLDVDPTDVEPSIVPAKIAEKLAADDFYEKSIYGIGYSYKERSDVKVVAQTPRAISWNETIRSHIEGLMQFGILGKEEHLLLPGGTVLLTKSATSRRLIELKSGTIRSRQLSPEFPQWSIVVSDWLQVDGNSRADIMVSHDEKANKVEVSVMIRGYARILKAGQNNVAEAPLLFAGARQLFYADKNESEVFGSPSKTYDDKFRKSTSQYFIKKNESKGRISSFLADDIQERAKVPLLDAIRAAKAALAEDDGISALEILLPIYLANKSSYELNLALGDSYSLLNLFKDAFVYYKESAKLNPTSAEPSMQIGMLYLRNGNWTKALQAFAAAKNLNYSDTQNLNYQMGVCEFNLGNLYAARNHFRYALWQAKNTDILRSTEEYLSGINTVRWYGVVGSLKVGRDSNVFQWGAGDRTDGYETAGSLFYEGEADFFLRAYDQPDGHMFFGFNINKRSYTDSIASKVSPMSQRLYMDWLLQIAQDASRQALVGIAFMPYLNLLSIGEERSGDSMGVDLGFSFARLANSPKILFSYESMSDPLPARDDKLDPVLREPVLPSDRSNFRSGYGLGFDFVKQGAKKVELSLMSSKVKYGETSVSVDDFSQYGLYLSTSAPLSSRVGLDADINFVKRTFANSSDSRKDSVLGLALDLTYLITPVFKADVGLSYKNQKSNRDISTYGRNILHLGISSEI